MAKIDNKKVREIVFNKYYGMCAYCGVELENRFTIDHIDPLNRHIKESKVLKNKISNYNPCCPSCNSSKNTFSLEKWRQQLEKQYDRCIRDSATFRSLLRFGVVEQVKKNVTFYFETL